MSALAIPPQNEQTAKIIMLGNSITHGGNWQLLLNREDVAERGVVSDIINGFYRRVQQYYEMKPSIIFIEGGINDIYNGKTALEVFEDYKTLIKDIASRNIKVVVQSTLYVNLRYKKAQEKNLVVKELNELLKNYCKENGHEFLNLNPFLAPDGVLRNEFTFDGLHLTSPAYFLWAEQVHDLLKDLRI